MKHRILVEFEARKPLPADFTDMVLNRVYTLDAVDKVECTATLVVDVKYGCHCDLEDGMKPDSCVIDENRREDCTYARRGIEKQACIYWKPIDAAKDTQ